MDAFEKEQEMARVANAVRDFGRPSLTAIYGVITKNEGELIGTGTFLRIRGRTYLLTAGHVAEYSHKYHMWAHSTKFGGNPAPITHRYRLLPKPFDLAVVPVNPKAIEGTEIQPLPVELLDTSGAIKPNEFIFGHGFPCHKSKPLPMPGGAVHSKSMPFHTSDGKTDWPLFNPNTHIAIEYPNSGWREEGKPIPKPDAHCLSGSALWRTNREHFSKADWAPDKARVIGVNILWTPHTEAIVATRVEVVRDFLLDVVKHDEAYFCWESRKRPECDDWADWFAAADPIIELRSEA